MNALAIALSGLAFGAEPVPALGPPACCVPATRPSPSLCGVKLECQRDVAHPFTRLPRVCPLEPLLCAEPATSSLTHCVPWVQEFHQAAQFPLPRFASDATPVVADGLLIYEGMRLTVYPENGDYELTFTATIPDMPVTVRLQLVFAEPEQGPVLVPPKATGLLVRPALSHRITLPPIRLEPRANARPGDPTAMTFQVTHRGSSTLFRKTSLQKIDSNWTVQRIGTARFGTPIVVDELNR